jgi:hypothetical protein
VIRRLPCGGFQTIFFTHEHHRTQEARRRQRRDNSEDRSVGIIPRVLRWSSTGNAPARPESHPARRRSLHALHRHRVSTAHSKQFSRSCALIHMIPEPKRLLSDHRAPAQIAIAGGTAPPQHPAGSFPEGFRTTAPVLVAASHTGAVIRNPLRLRSSPSHVMIAGKSLRRSGNDE